MAKRSSLTSLTPTRRDRLECAIEAALLFLAALQAARPNAFLSSLVGISLHDLFSPFDQFGARLKNQTLSLTQSCAS